MTAEVVIAAGGCACFVLGMVFEKTLRFLKENPRWPLF